MQHPITPVRRPKSISSGIQRIPHPRMSSPKPHSMLTRSELSSKFNSSSSPRTITLLEAVNALSPNMKNGSGNSPFLIDLVAHFCRFPSKRVMRSWVAWFLKPQKHALSVTLSHEMYFELLFSCRINNDWGFVRMHRCYFAIFNILSMKRLLLL